MAALLVGCDARTPGSVPNEPVGPERARVVRAQPSLADTAMARRERPITPADTSVAGAWRQLESALRSHDARQFNQLIDQESGLWVLEQPGALPAVTRVGEVGQFRRAHRELSLFSLGKQLMRCSELQLLRELPEADCGLQTADNAGFAVTGCLAGPAQAFRRLDLWPYASVKGGTESQGKAAQKLARATVLQTRTGYRFHFARSAGADGRWYLIFIDLREPCSA